MVRVLDQVQWAFSGTLGKSEAIISTDVSHNVYVAKQGFIRRTTAHGQ